MTNYLLLAAGIYGLGLLASMGASHDGETFGEFFTGWLVMSTGLYVLTALALTIFGWG